MTEGPTMHNLLVTEIMTPICEMCDCSLENRVCQGFKWMMAPRQYVTTSHPLRVVVQRNGSSVTPLLWLPPQSLHTILALSISRCTVEVVVVLLLLLVLAEDFGRCSSNAITITKLLAFPAMLLTLIHLLSSMYILYAGNYYQHLGCSWYIHGT